MAAVAIIFGGVAGYILAALAYLVFGAGLLTALAVWSFGGITILILAMLTGRLVKSPHSSPLQV